MATIRKRGKNWQVQIRRRDCPTLSQTFGSASVAKRWATQQEARLVLQRIPGSGLPALRTTTLADVVERYILGVCPRKRSAEVETHILKGFLRKGPSATSLSRLSSAPFAAYRDQRLKTVKPATVRRELALIRHVLEVAIRDWGYPILQNPLQHLRLPTAGPSRDRRLEINEMSRLFVTLDQSRNPHLAPTARLALETAMRQGELLRMQWKDIDLQRNTVHLPITKNGHPRTIPLTPHGQVLLRELMNDGTNDVVFPTTAEAIRRAWSRALKRAEIENFHFHDLRHEAVSRFFELGLSVPEVALISGHRDARMLFRYTHLRPESVGEKITQLQGRARE